VGKCGGYGLSFLSVFSLKELKTIDSGGMRFIMRAQRQGMVLPGVWYGR
jgi:hypothetical protein